MDAAFGSGITSTDTFITAGDLPTSPRRLRQSRLLALLLEGDLLIVQVYRDAAAGGDTYTSSRGLSVSACSARLTPGR